MHSSNKLWLSPHHRPLTYSILCIILQFWSVQQLKWALLPTLSPSNRIHGNWAIIFPLPLNATGVSFIIATWRWERSGSLGGPDKNKKCKKGKSFLSSFMVRSISEAAKCYTRAAQCGEIFDNLWLCISTKSKAIFLWVYAEFNTRQKWFQGPIIWITHNTYHEIQ